MEKRRYSPQLELLEWSTPFCLVKLFFFFSYASIRLLTKLACVASAGKFQATTKPMVTSEPAVPSALLLGLNPSNMPGMLNKDLTRSRRVFSSVPKPSKWRIGSAGRVNNNGASAGGGAGGPRAPPLVEKSTNKCKCSGTSILRRAKGVAKYVHYKEVR